MLRLFLAHFGLDLPRGARPPSRHVLAAVTQAFSRLPYENLSKIAKSAGGGEPERVRRRPLEVLEDHVARRAGGTCFALTALLLHLVRALGFRAEPILADRRYGADTHCALLVWLDGERHLLDPGYLITTPLAIREPAIGEPAIGETALRPLAVTTPFNEVVLAPRAAGRLDLSTRQEGGQTYRLTFKTEPVDAGDFLRAWDASFDWQMMHYPVLTRVDGKRHLYLQGNRFQVRTRDGVRREELRPDALAECIVREFGIDAALVNGAVRILARAKAGPS